MESVFGQLAGADCRDAGQNRNVKQTQAEGTESEQRETTWCICNQ